LSRVFKATVIAQLVEQTDWSGLVFVNSVLQILHFLCFNGFFEALVNIDPR
jgi:hypothetical protein